MSSQTTQGITQPVGRVKIFLFYFFPEKNGVKKDFLSFLFSPPFDFFHWATTLHTNDGQKRATRGGSSTEE
jgi:hypothetical protein